MFSFYSAHKAANFVDISMHEVPRLHGVPKIVVSD
jgi:hypothetical protein